MPKQMIQAIRVHQYGGPEQLKLEQIPCPEPQVGEVLIRVHAAGVLPAEWKFRQGFFQAFRPAIFPSIPGSAVAGVIEEIGPGVTSFQIGQAVFGRSTHGTYAEYTTTEVEPPALQPETFSLLALKPEELSFDEAATISGGATIAWTALFEDGALQAGQRVLIQGAAGGVGSFAVQFARWKGAQVIGTTSKANMDFVHALGAETVIDYTSTPFEQVVHDVDLVLDTIGGETQMRSMQVVKPGGRLVTLLEQPAQDVAQERGIHAKQNATIPTSGLLRTIAQLIGEGHVKPTLARTFSLQEASLAHELSQSGHGRGRIVLHIAD
ncbi:NADP-dependent oxidoreductase [Ktedonobacter robiniae]|uniref:NADPH:quinone reductase n=1 Tax=Ktedonobacter robiniae TaxID=2778365 RepID=A0ABQ3V806_9CHLR|nr:NADP-dependent oxidoreductase [Ktedonobacter robiniae]GHO60672.1 NADPH:quinone reductase [Ktedonobacter robiniae]